jgi:ACS family hexuronate transporter-like MFS transporter
MSSSLSNLTLPARTNAWKWWVCGLLLLATTINYMDRLTLNQLSGPIKKAFGLEATGYAQLEAAFASAFALGAIVMGWLADRWGPRWIYPAAVLGWSMAGFATGLAQSFAVLLLCRFLLGLAEAGNWPCALKTTQQILAPAERTLGNSILQSGAAFGAVITPVLLLGLFTWTGSWRVPFLAVGAMGTLWVLLWLSAVRPSDLRTVPSTAGTSLMRVLCWLVVLMLADGIVHVAGAAVRARREAAARVAAAVASPAAPFGVLTVPALADAVLATESSVAASAWVPSVFTPIERAVEAVPALPLMSKAAVTVLGILGVFVWLRRATSDDEGVPRGVFYRRFWVLAVVVVMINATWHFFRAWMPPFLQEQHGYTLAQMSWFSSGYYIATDIGSLAMGFAALALARRGLSVHRSRLTVFAVCALLTTLSLAAAVLPRGPLLLVVLMVIGFATLGLFPAYYSFSQELTTRHQGKLTGALGCVCWLSMALLQEAAGDLVKATGSYSLGVALAGLAPAVALLTLLVLWGRAPCVGAQGSPPATGDEGERNTQGRRIRAVGEGITADVVGSATGVALPTPVGLSNPGNR